MPDQTHALARFHQVLVDEIRESRPDYLRSSFTVAEIYQNLVPYRTHRDRVGAEMNGDYEDTLLRLLAGEGGYLILESEPARLRIQSELRSSNPNTTIYREFAAAEVRLDRSKLPPQTSLPPQSAPQREDPGPAPAPASDRDGPRAATATVPAHAPPAPPALPPRSGEPRESPRSPSVNPDLGLFVADLFGRSDAPAPAAAPPPPKAERQDVTPAVAAPVESAPPVVERTRAPEPVEPPPAPPPIGPGAPGGLSAATAPVAPPTAPPSSARGRTTAMVPGTSGLADENARLRRIVADQALEIQRLRELLDEQREA